MSRKKTWLGMPCQHKEIFAIASNIDVHLKAAMNCSPCSCQAQSLPDIISAVTCKTWHFYLKLTPASFRLPAIPTAFFV
jgi:hypothetical protein